MIRGREHVFGVLTGLVGAVLLGASGCGDGVQSRANSGNAPKAKTARQNDAVQSRAAGSDPQPVTTPAESQAGANHQADESSQSTPPAVEQADAPVEVSRPAAGGRKLTREITFDTLKFDIDKGEPFARSMLTAGIEKLEGARVRIRGYMLPSFQQSGITQFVLVRDNMECCFGPGAALYDCVIVEMVNDQSTSFSVRPIAVEGTFRVREFKGPDDMHLAVFHLDGERVR